MFIVMASFCWEEEMAEKVKQNSVCVILTCSKKICGEQGNLVSQNKNCLEEIKGVEL